MDQRRALDGRNSSTGKTTLVKMAARDAKRQQLPFPLISKLYENSSIIITTNLAFADWPQVFGEPSTACCPYS